MLHEPPRTEETRTANDFRAPAPPGAGRARTAPHRHVRPPAPDAVPAEHASGHVPGPEQAAHRRLHRLDDAAGGRQIAHQGLVPHLARCPPDPRPARPPGPADLPHHLGHRSLTEDLAHTRRRTRTPGLRRRRPTAGTQTRPAARRPTPPLGADAGARAEWPPPPPQGCAHPLPRASPGAEPCSRPARRRPTTTSQSATSVRAKRVALRLAKKFCTYFCARTPMHRLPCGLP